MPAQSDDIRSSSVLIVGTGAMACAFAGLLAPYTPPAMAGTWIEGLQALRRRGLKIEDGGRTATYPVDLVDAAWAGGLFDFALVLVKAWQTREAADRLEPYLASDGLALTLQNGLGNLEVLIDRLGKNRAAVGVTTLGARLKSPGVVQVTGKGPIILGEHPGMAPLVRLLERAGLAVHLTTDIAGLLWRKLVINAGINPLTAILQVKNGHLVMDQSAADLMRRAAGEAHAVASAAGIETGLDDPGEAAANVASQTAENFSSMLQDVRAGRPTEIEAITGEVVAKADEVGIDAPVNRTLLQLVRSIVQREATPR